MQVEVNTHARHDLGRLADGFRRVAGDEISALARREYGGNDVSDGEWARVFSAFGPHIPSEVELGRRLRNPDLGAHGMELFRGLDVVGELQRITCPTLVCVGELDPVTPLGAAREIVDALAPGVGQLEVIDGAGHFPWLDDPDAYWPVIGSFVEAASARQSVRRVL